MRVIVPRKGSSPTPLVEPYDTTIIFRPGVYAFVLACDKANGEHCIKQASHESRLCILSLSCHKLMLMISLLLCARVRRLEGEDCKGGGNYCCRTCASGRTHLGVLAQRHEVAYNDLSLSLGGYGHLLLIDRRRVTGAEDVGCPAHTKIHVDLHSCSRCDGMFID